MITVVSGIPRSGTSLMMQMLDAGGMPVLTDGIRGADEDNPRGYYELEVVKRLPDDTTWLADAEGKACKIISSLLPHLPASHEYRIIFMLRDLEEVLASQADMLRRRQAEEGPPIEMMRHHFEQHLRRIRRWLDGPRRMAVMYCRYQHAIEEPIEVARTVEAFLGLRLNLNAMATSVDRRLHRHRIVIEDPP